jgi:hypothetical protein
MFRNRPRLEISNQALNLINIIKKLTYVYIIIMLLKFLFGDFNSLVMDFILLIIIYCLLTNINFYYIAWCIFFLIISGYNTLTYILFILQDLYIGFISGSIPLFMYILVLTAQFILYILLINNFFKLYKESKIMFQALLNYRIIIIK